MSLQSWKNDVKMSPKKDKSVPQLVEKYLYHDKQTCSLDRDLLRRIIRTENPELFFDNPTNLKKLDRYLRKEFDQMHNGKNYGPERNKIIKETFQQLERNAKNNSKPNPLSDKINNNVTIKKIKEKFLSDVSFY